MRTGGMRAGGMRAGALAVVLAVLVGCSSDSGSTASDDRTLRVAIGESHAGFNYNSEADSGEVAQDVAQMVFFQAVRPTPSFKLDFSGLDRPPTVSTTSDGKQAVEWTIHRDARWSDGTPVTNADLQYFFQQVMDVGNDVISREGYDLITDVKLVGDKTVVATFENPTTAYLSLWTDVPQAAFMERNGGWNVALKDEPGPSAGPFMFDELEPEESLTLVANPDWWGEPKPGLDKIVLRFISEPDTQIEALRNDEVDVITPTPDVDLVGRLRDIPGIRMELSQGTAWVQLTYNFGNAVLADKAVRQAIAQAVDRDAIVNAMLTPILPSDASKLDNFVYVKGQAEYEAHGGYERAVPELAKQTLETAGWVGAPGEVRQKDGQRLAVRFTAASDGPLLPVQELIQQQLKAVGVDTTIDNCSLDCLLDEKLPGGDFDIALFRWFGGILPISGARESFSTGSALNYGAYSNPRFDQLTADAVAAVDPVQSVALANQADQALWEDPPGLPLYQGPTLVAVRDGFSGIGINNAGVGVFWNTQTWSSSPAAE